MKDKLFKSFQRIINNEKKNRQKIFIFLVFLLISATFWLLNALTKDYVTVIDFPVKYINTPENKVMVGELPEELHLLVKGNGFLLLQYEITAFAKPVVLDISNFMNVKKTDYEHKRYVLKTKQIEDRITKQLKSDMQLISVRPDTILFEFSNKVSKRVKVKADVKYSLQKQYVLKDEINIVPDTIEVTGPKVILDTLKYIKTVPVVLADLSETISQSLDIEAYPNLDLSKKKINIEIPVEKYTEQEVEIKIDIINVPDSIKMDIYPENVNIIYHVGLSKFNRIDQKDFNAIVDYNDIEKTISRSVKITLIKSPEDVFDVKYSPNSVQYLLRRND